MNTLAMPARLDAEFREPLLESLPAAVYTTDREGRITFYNRAAAALWGREPAIGEEKWCGSHRIIAPTGEPVPLDQCPTAQVLAGASIEHHREIIIERPDGTRAYVLAHPRLILDQNGRCTGAINMLTDITGQKRAESELSATRYELGLEIRTLGKLHELAMKLAVTRELAPALQAILETLVDMLGAQHGLISLYEPASGHLDVVASTGFNDSLLGQMENAAASPDGGACGGCFGTKQRVIVLDTEVDWRFAAYREISRAAGFRTVHGAPILTRPGDMLGVLSVHFDKPQRLLTAREQKLTDICARKAADFTERKRAENALRETDQRKDEFLATLAHELRNPLAPMRNALELLKRTKGDEELMSRARGIMERQVAQMVRLVDELLDISRITGGRVELRRETIDIKSAVEAALEMAQPLIEQRGHQISVVLPDQPVYLNADRTRLAQVLSNLLNNAAKYMKQGGKIELVARAEQGEAVISIRDTGAGIAADMLPHVFRMFTQVERAQNQAQSGLGVGLALARHLVELHEGTLTACSAGLGHGSEFTVRLPAMTGNVTAPRPADQQCGDTPVSGRRILVVDDNVDCAESLAAMLRMSGHDVAVAHDGLTAIDRAAQSSPDIVLLDIGMPGLDGYETARRLRSNTGASRSTLVAITGWGQDRDVRMSYEAGFDYHLVKPVDPVQLMDLVANSKPPAPAPEAVSATAPGDRRRVLIVDDNDAMHESVKHLLSETGCEVRTASNGVEALDIAQAWAPHYVFLDLYMPLMGGIEAARKLRARFPAGTMKLIMMSGESLNPALEEGAKQAGFDTCIDKLANPDRWLTLLDARA